MTTASTPREVTRVVSSHRQTEGAGFIVRRPFPTPNLSHLDPFLLIDEMGPADYQPGEAVGAPDHPHRGFETITYMLEGEFEHEDSAGHRGALRAGDVQWMTAGAGIIHSEEPSRRIRQEGGRVHGFQIWLNLPAKLKMSQPRYQEVPSERIPRAQTPDGKARVRVVAGRALGVDAVIDTHTPITYQDWQLDPGADAEVDIPAGQTALAFVFEGSARVGETLVTDGQLALLGDGDRVRLRGPDDGDTSGRLLLLAGAPLGEPVARYGPFVMNTQQEIAQAIDDYRSGKMGEIVRTARIG
jgi:redox-sensitive bicupin YhaK (pirin superfamily)